MSGFRSILEALRSALSKRAGLLRVLALVGSALLMTAATPNAAEACGITDIPSCVALLFIKIFQLLTALMGWILVLEVDALIRVSQYHNFVSPGPSAVRVGWIVTRDLANMFFIVILLIIAFGTILGSSTYHYEKNLPRLLIMAVVINFSKTICGIFIDMGQVIMLTFVNGFKEAAGGNFVNAFQINKLLALGDSSGSYTFGMVVAMMFAFILSAIAVSVVLVMLVSMIFRVVMLWVLIILSPIAFLSSAIPKGGDYYGEWWKEFKAQIIRGPVIAFFLWLALASVQDAGGQGGLAGEGQGFPKGSTASAAEASGASNIGDSKIPSEAGATSDVIMNMIIAICLMFAGLKFGTQVGGVGMGTANSVRNAVSKAARGVATYGAKRAAQPFMTGGGKLLAKVPLVGGLGRAAVLKGESWKKDRQAGREKFAGTPEDMARLSTSAFARRAGSVKDPKEAERYLKAAAGNPAAMAALTATTTSRSALTGEVKRKSAAKDLLSNMVASGKGAEAAKEVLGDKRLTDMVKNDPELLKTMHVGMEKAATANPNLKKDLAAFETKFAVPMYENNTYSSIEGVKKDKLRSLAPKMSADDISGLDEAGVSLMSEYLSAGQTKKIMEDGKTEQIDGLMRGLNGSSGWKTPLTMSEALTQKGIRGDQVSAQWMQNPAVAAFALADSKNNAEARSKMMKDPDKKPLLQQAAQAGLAAAQATKDDRKIAAAALQSLTVGSLKAGDIKGDLKTSIGKGMDAASYSKSMNREDGDQMAAANVAFAAFKEFNPEKAKNLSKHEQYQDFGLGEASAPSVAVSAAAPAAVKVAPVKIDPDDIKKFSDALETRAGQLRGTSGGGPNPFASRNQEELRKITEAVKSLNESMTKYGEAQRAGDKAQMEALAATIGKLREGMNGKV